MLLKSRTGERPAYLFFKRFSDIVLSVLAVIALLPLLLLTALSIKLDSRGTVIYSQPRAGKNGKIFKMYKFRSMCEDADEKLRDLQDLNEKDGPVFKITNDPRTTRVGRIIRRNSIDELPQLINIIMGDMSIVGPRPPLLNEVEQYTPYQMQRLLVKPGLTCYWQISGRSNLSFADWVQLDLKYISERSLRTDFKIIFKTVPAVLFGRGAY
ncbi:MAG TPA: exopolysaccharide biosynthesis polyprenyl glycosylphosphotransferase [Caproiciproducens sp.]|nr:exopolysaccharide biosynthesis polyprenyl glycosylphosphotransferase [Caproiciproducens sp.]